MFDDEMPVEQNRFHFGERRIIAIDVAPARLRHGQLEIGEIRHGAPQKIRWRNKIGVEDGDEFSQRGLQSLLQRTRLESFAVVAMNVTDRQPQALIALDAVARHFLRLVGGIVEHLNIQQLARIIERGNRFHQTLDHVTLVVNRKLHGDAGPRSNFRRRPGDALAIFVIVVDQRIAMNAVHRQNGHDEEVRQHDHEVESVQLVKAAEGIQLRVRIAAPIVGKRVAGGRGPGDHGAHRLRRRIIKPDHCVHPSGANHDAKR